MFSSDSEADVMRLARHFSPFPIERPYLRVQGLGVRQLMPPCYIHRPRGWPHFLFILFHGPADCQTREARRPVTTGTLVCWRPGTPHGLGNPAEPWDHSWLSVGGTDVERALADVGFPLDAPLALHDLSFADASLAELFDELDRPASGPDALDERLVRNDVVNMIRRLARGARSPVRPRVPPRLADVRAHVHSNFHRRLTLSGLADIANLSTSQFCLLHKAHFGISVMAFVREVRLQHAAALLRDSDLKVHAVARLCGYEDHFHFSKAFKREFGSPPGAYRERSRVVVRVRSDARRRRR